MTLLSYLRLLGAAGTAQRGGRPGTGSADAKTLEYATQLLAEARNEVDRADNKAQILLAGAGVGAGALAGGLLAGSWSPRSLDATVEWLWWLGFAVAACGVGMLARAVYPRGAYGSRPVTRVEYFMDAARFSSERELIAELRRSADERLEATANQLRLVSAIVTLKYRAVAWAMWLFTVALVCCTAAVFLDGWAV
ncbi:Pycsar system effector family protein [Streptomyces sp. NPDC096132]|uniref:Pycsar system effector family protein n=1 Tax=Streptomyces sp. NPDC096132 TaxID=3366075 RepID=UPI00382E415E